MFSDEEEKEEDRVRAGFAVVAGGRHDERGLWHRRLIRAPRNRPVPPEIPSGPLLCHHALCGFHHTHHDCHGHHVTGNPPTT